jgi:hypothetical protein
MAGSTRTKRVPLSASGQVLAGEGWISSIFVDSVTTSLSIVLYNALTATGTAVHTISVAGATNYPMDNEHYTIGCYATLTGTGAVVFRTLEDTH